MEIGSVFATPADDTKQAFQYARIEALEWTTCLKWLTPLPYQRVEAKRKVAVLIARNDLLLSVDRRELAEALALFPAGQAVGKARC